MVKTTKEMIEVMQAFERGEKVEAKDKLLINSEWGELKGPRWNWGYFDYRVAPKPKKQIKVYCYFGNNALFWVTRDRLDEFPKYVRVPSEDKIIEVNE